jgi:hypothetical protein
MLAIVTYQRAASHLCIQLVNTKWMQKLVEFEQQKTKGLGFAK